VPSDPRRSNPAVAEKACFGVESSFAAAMAPSCAAPRYVSNKSLGIKRPPTAFSLYLKALAGQAHRHVGSRIVGKTTVFRMGLLRRKFENLEEFHRQQYIEAAAAAMLESKKLRQAALRNVNSTSCGGSQVTDQPSGPAGVRPPEPEPAVVPEPAVAGPQAGPSGETIDWIDPASGDRRCLAVLHEIGRGVFGVCKKVVDVDTQEVFCAKLPTDEPTAGTALRAEWVFMKRCDHPNIPIVDAFDVGEPVALQH